MHSISSDTIQAMIFVKVAKYHLQSIQCRDLLQSVRACKSVADNLEIQMTNSNRPPQPQCMTKMIDHREGP